MSGLDDDFEEWKLWFDSHKEPNGSINLDKHPDLVSYIQNMFEPKKPRIEDLMKIKGLGETVNFDLTNIKKSWED